MASCKPERGLSPKTDKAGTILILDFLASISVRNKFLLLSHQSTIFSYNNLKEDRLCHLTNPGLISHTHTHTHTHTYTHTHSSDGYPSTSFSVKLDVMLVRVERPLMPQSNLAGSDFPDKEKGRKEVNPPLLICRPFTQQASTVGDDKMLQGLQR